MIRIFGDYTPDIEQYSIDEAFLNMTGSEDCLARLCRRRRPSRTASTGSWALP